MRAENTAISLHSGLFSDEQLELRVSLMSRWATESGLPHVNRAGNEKTTTNTKFRGWDGSETSGVSSHARGARARGAREAGES